MASTQKLIIIILLINLCIGIALSIGAYGGNASPATTISNGTIEGFINYSQGVWVEYNKSETWSPPIDQSDVVEPQGIGDAFAMGNIIKDVFINGINVHSTCQGTYTNQLEYYFARGTCVIRWILAMILVVELYMLIINRKTS